MLKFKVLYYLRHKIRNKLKKKKLFILNNLNNRFTFIKYTLLNYLDIFYQDFNYY